MIYIKAINYHIMKKTSQTKINKWKIRKKEISNLNNKQPIPPELHRTYYGNTFFPTANWPGKFAHIGNQSYNHDTSCVPYFPSYNLP